jgi:hypothetical protein
MQYVALAEVNCKSTVGQQLNNVRIMPQSQVLGRTPPVLVHAYSPEILHALWFFL